MHIPSALLSCWIQQVVALKLGEQFTKLKYDWNIMWKIVKHENDLHTWKAVNVMHIEKNNNRGHAVQLQTVSSRCLNAVVRRHLH